jgi:hypothetical protein
MNKNASFSPKFNARHFDEKTYFSNLSTKKVGSIILFTELAESTMSSIEK